MEGLFFLSNTTVPASDCKNLPEGAAASSAGTTLATLDLAEGFYRTSNKSDDVLECYRKGSCMGGLNASNYCATGYEGPCESNDENRPRRYPCSHMRVPAVSEHSRVNSEGRDPSESHLQGNACPVLGWSMRRPLSTRGLVPRVPFSWEQRCTLPSTTDSMKMHSCRLLR